MLSFRSLVIAAMLALVLAVLSFWLLDFRTALISTLFGWAMLAIAISDAMHFIVPDILSLPSIPAGLLVAGLLSPGEQPFWVILNQLAAALFGVTAFLTIKTIYALLRKREGLGWGDVKLAGVAGSWSGLAGLANIMLLATFLAMTYVLLSNWRGLSSVKATTPVPFGAFFAPSIWMIWFAQMSGVEFHFM